MEPSLKDIVLQTDRSRMRDLLLRFHEQLEAAYKLVENVPLSAFPRRPRRILVLGMGGSAIAADLLRTYVSFTPGADYLDIRVHRSYSLPLGLVDRQTLVIASSYSGNTEETLTAFEYARQRSPYVACLTSGGWLSERSHELGLPHLPLPQGYPPRGTVGFSFFALLLLFLRLGYFRKATRQHTEAAWTATHQRLQELAAIYGNLDHSDNPTLRLAHQLTDKVPIIYASDRMEAVGLRWRQQLHENAKHIAFGNVVPEMNHNEICGWLFPTELSPQQVHFLWLYDPEDHPRVQLRIRYTPQLLAPRVPPESHTSLCPTEPHFLTRLFSLLYFGDWLSYWLAILHRTDPMPVPPIEELKRRLAAHPYEPAATAPPVVFPP
ncbi:MAG: bifunctional phosphoglucose/phosphomannose isomerase [Chlorobiota bacterium]